MSDTSNLSTQDFRRFAAIKAAMAGWLKTWPKEGDSVMRIIIEATAEAADLERAEFGLAVILGIADQTGSGDAIRAAVDQYMIVMRDFVPGEDA